MNISHGNHHPRYSQLTLAPEKRINNRGNGQDGPCDLALSEGLVGGDITVCETEYIIISGDRKHLGDKPQAIGGEGTFVGTMFEAKFDLPENVDLEEEAVIQCRIKSNEINNKRFLLNCHNLDDVFKPHPENRDEWMQEIGVVPKGWLTPGENIINIGYSDERYDDFLVDNIVMWYKIKLKERATARTGDLDSLDHLSTVKDIPFE